MASKNMTPKEKKSEYKKQTPGQAQGKTLSGVITSTAMKDTVAVLVSRYVKHLKYKKYQKLTKKYLVHAPAHTASLGDRAVIAECRPISKHKHFVLVSVTKGQVLETVGEEILENLMSKAN